MYYKKTWLSKAAKQGTKKERDVAHFEELLGMAYDIGDIDFIQEVKAQLEAAKAKSKS
jgi:hypothetical protein